jgi:chromosome segregation ATPase
MTIVEALKEKNRLVRKVLELQKRVSTYNCVIEGNPRAYEPKEVMDELNDTIEELISMKTRITQANQSIQEKIYRLAELKTQIRFLNTVPTSEGKAPAGKSFYTKSETYIWESSIKAQEIDRRIAKLENEISKIQKELDAYNYNTSI